MMGEHKDDPKFKVIDVRTGFERKLSHIPRTEHIPLSDLEERIGELSKENTYVVYCRSGARSQTATNLLKSRGFNAINMTGGMNSWGGETDSSCNIY